MTTLLIVIIYLAFISLGLPDSLLGSAWPTMHLEIGSSLSSVGIISMIISASTIISSLLSDWLNRKLGTHRVIYVCVLTTSIALYLFSIANQFWQLCLIAIPYGLGAGSIDAALNNYVALHLKASHMSWLHCMWGVGATISPMIMSFALTYLNSYRMGYRIVSFIQLAITAIIILSKTLWNTDKSGSDGDRFEQESISIVKVFQLNGAKEMLVSFLCYCAIEGVCFVWASSYFADGFMVSAEQAALFGSLYYGGMMVSRAISGFIANQLGDRKLIRYGSIIIVASALVMLLANHVVVSIACFILMGLGSGPVYPSLIHGTTENFDHKYSQSIIGVQMAVAYTGSTFSPYLFGLIAQYINIKLLALIVLILAFLVLYLSNIYYKKTAKAI